jgi:Ca2+-binding RTX toxin-like protein
VTVLGGSGHDVLSGGNGNDVIVGGAGSDWCSGAGGDDTLVGARGDDTLSGGQGDDSMSGGAGIDHALTEGSDSYIESDTQGLTETWAPLEEQNYGNVLKDLRVKFVAGRGYVAVLDFVYGSTGYRDEIIDVRRDGKTFYVTTKIEKWLGAAATMITQHLQTKTLAPTLAGGTYHVVVRTPNGVAVTSQRFVVGA